MGRLGAWGLGRWRVEEERWVSVWVGKLSWQGVEEERKKKLEKRRAVVWVGNEWRKRWIEAGHEKWVGQRLGRRYRLARWKKREKYLREEGERSEE